MEGGRDLSWGAVYHRFKTNKEKRGPKYPDPLQTQRKLAVHKKKKKLKKSPNLETKVFWMPGVSFKGG